MSDINTILSDIQSKLKAPKSQYNSFGNFKYRSLEDIVEAVKPLLKEHGATLTLSDDIIDIGGRIYVKATAHLMHQDKAIQTVAYAREAETKKGMDEAQITGSASSYARKYACNGLFAIDDTKDADTDEHTTVSEPKIKPKMINTAQKAALDKLIKEKGMTEDDFSKKVGKQIDQLSESEANKIINKLQNVSE